MASGLSQRFGSNKLLAEFKGRSLIEIILENTEDICGGNTIQFAKEKGASEAFIENKQIEIKRLVLTRTKEVYEYCQNNDIDVILHQYPNRNEAVKLGIENMMDCDACIFCTCDQPLLSQDSINNIISDYISLGKGIYRLSFGEKVGNPILFSKEYFDELLNLPEKKGGAYIASKYPLEVICVAATSGWELYDVDTPDDLIKLSEVITNKNT